MYLIGIFRLAEMLITASQIKEHASLRARTNSVFFPFVTCCKQGPKNIYLNVLMSQNKNLVGLLEHQRQALVSATR